MSYGYGGGPGGMGQPARCPSCGGVSTNPHDTQCRFCGAMLSSAPPAQAAAYPSYGPPQQQGAYGQPPPFQQQPYPQQPYPQQPYPQQPYPQQGYGPPMQQMPYQGYPQYPGVQAFGAGYGRQVNRNWFGSGMSTFFWIRIAAVAFFIVISGFGACVSAISNH